MATGDILMIVEGVTGEAHDAVYTNSIELEFWQWGVTQDGVASSTPDLEDTRGAQDARAFRQPNQRHQLKHVVSVSDIGIGKRVDESSMKLVNLLLKNKPVKEIKIVTRKQSGIDSAGKSSNFDYLVATLFDARVMTHSFSAQNGGGIPIEFFGLNFAKIKMEYARQKPDGTKAVPVSFEYTAPAAEMRF